MKMLKQFFTKLTKKQYDYLRPAYNKPIYSGNAALMQGYESGNWGFIGDNEQTIDMFERLKYCD